LSRRTFTESADPAVEAAIERRLALVVDRARAVPDLDAVLLGGSLGRGEGTVLDGAVQSDAELYLVGRSPGIRRVAAQLELELNAAGSLPQVSIAWLDPRRLARGWTKNLSRRAARSIHLYELAAGSRVLLGSAPRALNIDPAAIPLAEGVRLILNRLAEASSLVAAHDPDAPRWLDKILIACGDALLLAVGRYHVSYRERAGRMLETHAPWPMPQGWRSTVLAAYERKLRGGGSAPAVDLVADHASAALRGAVAGDLGLSVASWTDFPAAFVRKASRRKDYLRYLPPLGPAATYEGLIILSRVRRARLRIAPRTAVAAVGGKPLSLVTQGAAAPLFVGIATRDAVLVRAAADSLVAGGIPRAELNAPEDAEAVARTLGRYWEVSA
jgi:hypothetical protein